MPEERKLVSILFADVTGSTALADSLDAEDIRALMSRYYEHARRIISPYGGTLEKFIGDAIMAVFGLSQVHGDDAERALASALALREAIATDQVLAPHNIQLRIGVNTGEVVAASNPDRLDFLITGDAVNVAARLQQGANPGEIIASDRTASAARHAFFFEEERELRAKGKPQPLRVFPLKGPRSVRQIERPTFIGRQQELLQLIALKERILQERRPQFASIVAPSGTGKSRLLEEFLHRLSPNDGFKIAFARCLPYGQTLTYWPLRGLLTELLGASPEKERVQAVFVRGGYGAIGAARLTDLMLATLGMEEQSEDTSKLARPGKNVPSSLENTSAWLKFAGLDELNTFTKSSTPPDPEHTLSFAQSLIGLEKTLEMTIRENVDQIIRKSVPSSFRTNDRKNIFAAWRLFIEALTNQTPCIIVFEDLHWASDNLLDLVEYVIQQHTSTPVFLLALSRPELLDRRPFWRNGYLNVTSLALQPLDEQQIRDLVTSTSNPIPEAIREQIVTRSGGNPFFALELLHTFTDLRSKGEVPDNAILPDTVHAAVLARIDQLNRQERAILQIASVASRSFRRSMLISILADSSHREIDEALNNLIAHDMFVLIEGETYNFRHILFRDVAYGLLSRQERIRLHSKIAFWMETAAHDHLYEYIELIAYHYRESLQLSRQSAVPLELPFKNEHAARVFERAAMLAARSGSFAEVNTNFLLAIELAPPAEHIRLHEAHGDSVAWGSIPYEAYKQALACWRATEDRRPEMGARLIRKFLNVTTRTTMRPSLQPSETAALRVEGLSLAQSVGNTDEQWRLRVTECFDPKFWGSKRRKASRADLAPLREIALRAADYFELRQNQVAMSEALDGCMNVTVYLQDWQRALELSQRRLAIPDLPPEEWADVISSLALIYYWRGEYTHAISSIQSALTRLKPGHPVASLSRLVTMLASISFLIGQWDEVISLLPRLQEIYEHVQYDQEASARVMEGYLAVLRVALAREDQSIVDVVSPTIQKYADLYPVTSQGYLSALLTNDIEKITLNREQTSDSAINVLCAFFNEHGKPMPDDLLQLFLDEPGLLPACMRDYLQISLALRENDPSHLARAIDEAESHQLIPHAARMRIILAQRSSDPVPLAHARPILTSLGDRQFLSHLTETSEMF